MSVVSKSIRDEFALIIFVSILTFLGGYVRLAPALLGNFPINDGGLFFSMTKDLIANQFRLPVYATYNHFQVAFAYPPLAFYLAGGLSTLFNINLIDLFRILPALISTLMIPAFFLLARDLAHSGAETLLAVLVFSFLPASYDWLIMGGGITRALGFFFSILAFWAIQRLYKGSGWLKYGILTVLFAAMAILSHPEVALHTVVGMGVFFLFFGLNLKGMLKSIGSAVGTLVLTAPWWVLVLQRHGLEPFMAAGRTGGYRLDLWLSYFQLNLTAEIALTFGGCLAVIGIFAKLAKRDYFLPTWVLVTVLAEPRSAVARMLPCLAILAGFTLTEIVLPWLRQMDTKQDLVKYAEGSVESLFSGRVARYLLTYLLIYFIVSAYTITYKEAHNMTLSDGSQKAFGWINTNLAAGHYFAIITGGQPLSDPVSEWFPALTQQVSAATVQGLEWYPGEDFSNYLLRSYQLQLCSNQDADCVKNWQIKNDLFFNYIYIDKNRIRAQQGLTEGSIFLQKSLLEEKGIEPVYESNDVIILKVNK